MLCAEIGPGSHEFLLSDFAEPTLASFEGKYRPQCQAAWLNYILICIVLG